MYNAIFADTKEVLKSGFTSSCDTQAWISERAKTLKSHRSIITSKVVTDNGTNKNEVDVEDVAIAKFYLLKAERAASKGIEFNLSFQSFKNMSKAKYCSLTGLELSAETFTIDRIDNKKGYVKGNVCACHKEFNRLKAIIENPSNDMTIGMVARALSKANDKIKSS